MTTIVNRPDQNHDPRNGKMHDLFSGKTGESVSTPTGAVWPWKDAPLGSLHLYQGTQQGHVYLKSKDNNANNDWGVAIGCIAQTVALADLTDGGAAQATINLTPTLPTGSIVLATSVVDVTGFAGDTSCTLKVGTASDDDRYMTGTPSVFASADSVVMGVPSGVRTHTAAQTVLCTLDSAAEWGSVTAGAFTVRIYYVI